MSNPYGGDDDNDWGDISAESNKIYCQFTKHSGELWFEVVRDDREYVEWLVSGEHDMELGEELYDYLMELLEES